MPEHAEYPEIILLNSSLQECFRRKCLLTHLSALQHTIAHLLSVSKLNLYRIEQATDISLQEILEFKAPNTNLGPSLGAAGSRTEAQNRMARSHTLEALASIPDGQPIAFTDGSALGNP